MAGGRGVGVSVGVAGGVTGGGGAAGVVGAVPVGVAGGVVGGVPGGVVGGAVVPGAAGVVPGVVSVGSVGAAVSVGVREGGGAAGVVGCVVGDWDAVVPGPAPGPVPGATGAELLVAGSADVGAAATLVAGPGECPAVGGCFPQPMAVIAMKAAPIITWVAPRPARSNRLPVRICHHPPDARIAPRCRLPPAPLAVSGLAGLTITMVFALS